MISCRRPPTFIPTTPLSQPGMTMPPPSLNWNGWWRSHDASNCLPVEYAIPTYWTETVLPVFATAPLPFTMSRILSEVGGVPVGRPIGGFLPSFVSPGAGGTRLGPFGAAGLVLVEVAVPDEPPAGIALVLLLPPQPAALRARATSRAAR